MSLQLLRFIPNLPTPKKADLPTLLPELKRNQWKMVTQVLIHDLDLNKKQIVKLNKLMGVE
jgi:hypothetical protein